MSDIVAQRTHTSGFDTPPRTILRVRAIRICHEDVFGGNRYELETTQTKGAKSTVHIDPRHDQAAYDALLELVPGVRDMDKNDTTRRRLVPVHFLDVKCELKTRNLKGMKGIWCAVGISEIPIEIEKDTAVVPNIPGAIAVMEARELAERDRLARQNAESRAEFAAITNERDNDVTDAAPNEQLNKIDAQQSGDELTAPVWSATTSPANQQQFSAFNHFQRELLKIEGSADVTENILNALGEPLGVYISTHGIDVTCEALQMYLDELSSKNALQGPGNQQASVPVPNSPPSHASDDILSVKQPSKWNEGEPKTMHSESPVVVYPMATGSIVYNDIRFSVTLRQGGTFDMAIVLMNEFLQVKHLIDRSCLVTAPVFAPAQPTSAAQAGPPRLAQSTPQEVPAASGMPDGKGRVPGQRGTTKVTGVEKTKKDGKITVELWGTGKWADHYLKLETEHGYVTALGYDVERMEIGERYPVSWIADWVVAENRTDGGKGNYYLNVSAIRDNAASLPRAS